MSLSPLQPRKGSTSPTRRWCRTLLLILFCWQGTAHATSPSRTYDIRSGKTPLGVGHLSLTQDQGRRVISSSAELPLVLQQHNRLWLNAKGWPVRYRLDARLQDKVIRIEVRREHRQLIETVTRAGKTQTQRFAAATAVDFIDNNTLGGLQALLNRLHGKPQPGSQLRVFLPQARQFGVLHFLSVRTALKTINGRRIKVRVIKAQLKVNHKQVPLRLWLDPADGVLLRFDQPQRQVTMTLR